MSTFEFISVALSFVIGLGLARLLTSGVELFRARRTVRLHWLPIVWAGMVFLWMIQYWWAIFELSHLIDVWSMWRFMFLLVLALLLFTAAALVLPVSGAGRLADLRADFDLHGRWALLALTVYFLVAVSGNTLLFGLSPVAPMNLMQFALATPPALVLTIRNRRVQAIVTVLNIPLSIHAFRLFSPDAY